MLYQLRSQIFILGMVSDELEKALKVSLASENEGPLKKCLRLLCLFPSMS